jgi:hypothetical protein
MNKNLITSTLLILFTVCLTAQVDSEKDVDQYRNKGYFNITKLGYISVSDASLETFAIGEGVVLTTLPSDDANAFGFHTINGYFFNPYFSAGIGIGLDGYNNPNYNTLPIYLDLRGYLTDGLGSPYAYLNYGTLVEIQNGPQNGNMFNIGLGYKIPLNEENRFVIVGDIGYSYKAVSNDGKSINESESYVMLKGIAFSIGVMF